MGFLAFLFHLRGCIVVKMVIALRCCCGFSDDPSCICFWTVLSILVLTFDVKCLLSAIGFMRCDVHDNDLFSLF